MQLQPLTPDLIAGHHVLAHTVEVACSAHAAQVRKGTSIPYVSHLLQVAGLVLEFGGSLRLAAAGVLHDAVEDTDLTLDDIREMFSDDIYHLVAACTDTADTDTPGAKAPWHARKARHLVKLETVSNDAALVIACDKLHNLRTQISDLMHGAGTVKFNAPYEERRWLQNAVLDILRPKLPTRLLVELSTATREWEDLHELLMVADANPPDPDHEEAV